MMAETTASAQAPRHRGGQSARRGTPPHGCDAVRRLGHAFKGRRTPRLPRPHAGHARSASLATKLPPLPMRQRNNTLLPPRPADTMVQEDILQAIEHFVRGAAVAPNGLVPGFASLWSAMRRPISAGPQRPPETPPPTLGIPRLGALFRWGGGACPEEERDAGVVRMRRGMRGAQKGRRTKECGAAVARRRDEPPQRAAGVGRDGRGRAPTGDIGRHRHGDDGPVPLAPPRRQCFAGGAARPERARAHARSGGVLASRPSGDSCIGSARHVGSANGIVSGM